MRFALPYRNALLLTGSLPLGIAAVQAVDWSRQITDSRDTHALESQLQCIASANVTLTSSLLVINAPMIASDVTTPNSRVVDDQGFLRQWSKVVKEHKLQRPYIGESSVEAVAAQILNLILTSATGGDSVLALYDQLSTIAPALIINYDDKNWQSLLTQLDEIIGHEKRAAERIAQFDKQLAAAKERIELPSRPITAIVYTAAAHNTNLWTPGSAQGQMLEQLGFTLAKLSAGLGASQNQGERYDITQLGEEGLAVGLNGESLFLFAGDQKDADAIYANSLLTHLPAIQNRQVYALGTETFRLNYHSVMQMLDRLKALF